jgi:hypothetical protein
MCQVFIESLLSAAGKRNTFAKYKDPAIDKEFRSKQIEDMQKELFGNETSVGDALAHNYGVVVPHEFEKATTPVITGKEE